jgi:hypothetical protein
MYCKKAVASAYMQIILLSYRSNNTLSMKSLLRADDCTSQPKRSAANGFASANGVSPVIISASSRPVAGPSVRP